MTPTPATIDPGHCFTVKRLCERWVVDNHKVLGLIASGELRAINLALSKSGRPRWRISSDAVEAFEARRSSAPVPRPRRRRQPKRQWREYI